VGTGHDGECAALRHAGFAALKRLLVKFSNAGIPGNAVGPAQADLGQFGADHGLVQSIHGRIPQTVMFAPCLCGKK
jgi:hypothetical protein